ncbi:putative HTH-type transcriptional regulator YetL [Capsulimonas corticalis]|uniref:HTH-type transcriptional regulator YetL n=1 Tax=Capsulimonas corticalis TaxID=2219043 RepID=A0A402D3F9_9BACT|nr:MarR family transcriptional regulator [Capsulimonas corticalis]BDI28552.1 putative HTH-type transcriptional regulator YetL [Capsulimonas corticalis]
MGKETPTLNAPLKEELLRKISQRYPDLDASAMESITAVKHAAKTVSVVMNAPLEEVGLSEGKFFVLCYLFTEELLDHPAPGPSDIADNLGVTRATVTGLLDGLERDGYLERRHCCEDRRALAIGMTDKTRRFLEDYMPGALRSAKELMTALDETERRELIRLLSKIKGVGPDFRCGY